MERNETIRSDDIIATYSLKGPSLHDHLVKPDLVAPGNRIASVASADGRLLKNYSQNRVLESDYKIGGANKGVDRYIRLSDTSMATPMVSGAAALLLHKEPGLTPDQVKARFMKTATKSFPAYSIVTDPATGETFRSQYDIFAVGAGYLDGAAALASSEVAPAQRRARSPRAVYEPSTRAVSVVDDCTALWGTAALWETTALLGTTAVWGTNVLSGSTALWGTSVPWGTTVLWGTTALWGTADLSGTGVEEKSVLFAVTREGACPDWTETEFVELKQ